MNEKLIKTWPLNRELCCSTFAKKTAEDLAEQYGGDAVCIDSLISGKSKQGQSGEYVVSIGSHSFYLSLGYFYWLVIQSKFHSFFCYKRFSFSKSNLKYMTKILIDIQLAILKKTRLINLAADLCFEFIICHLLHSQAWYYLL